MGPMFTRHIGIRGNCVCGVMGHFLAHCLVKKKLGSPVEGDVLVSYACVASPLACSLTPVKLFVSL